VKSKFRWLDLRNFVCSLFVIAKSWKVWRAEHAAHILFGRFRGIIQISKLTCSHRDTSQRILGRERRTSGRTDL